jgi:nucleoside-triphosphatase THEP1
VGVESGVRRDWSRRAFRPQLSRKPTKPCIIPKHPRIKQDAVASTYGHLMNVKNILLTGPPRCGKSTVIEKLIKQIHKPITGFFTREMREKGRRVGFSITTLDGKEGVLAHKESKSKLRVGKYGVNIDDLDRIAVPSMIPNKPDQIVIIDEIGKMEYFSPLFRETLIKILDSANPVIGSIAQKGNPFIEKIKERKDVLFVTVDQKNRDLLPAYLLEQIPAR